MLRAPRAGSSLTAGSPPQFPQRPAAVAVLALAIVLPFTAAFVGIAFAVKHSTAVEQQIRIAQTRRAAALRYQLDEETGVRGYVDTRDADFLQPYRMAELRLPAIFAALRKAVMEVAPEALRYVDDEKATHQLWLDRVAGPLIARPEQASRLELQVEGKRLIDRVRDDDDATLRTLEEAAQRSDIFAYRVVYAIMGIGLVLGSALLVVILQIGARQQRLREEIRVERALHEQERRIADSLQDALMPYDVPSVPGLSLYAIYRPAAEPERVGGDWYDVIPMPDGRIMVIIGDVVGHGIGAIQMMSRVRRKIMAAALHQSDPGAIMTDANRQALKGFPSTPLVGTALCAFIDPKTGKMVYANAGHPAPILVDADGRVNVLSSSDLMLGVQDYRYQTYVAQASTGSLLVFYTDGLLEFTRNAIEGEQNIIAAARAIVAASPQDAAAALREQILGDGAPHDDVAILTIRFGNAQDPRIDTITDDTGSSMKAPAT